ncbi:MAG: tetratricopeptide repeat protein [Verrucomicrobiota bacterium]
MLGSLSPGLSAQDEEGFQQDAISMVADWPAWRWKTLAGDDALQAGLPGLAEGLYLGVLEENPDLNEDARAWINIKLVSALIAQRKFDEAEAALPPQSGSMAYAVALRRAILAYSRSDLLALEQSLAQIRPEFLSQADLPWYYLLRGMEARMNDDLENSAIALEKALNQAVSPAQAAQIEAVVLKGDVIAGKDDLAVLPVLKSKVAQTRGTRAGFDFARQLAVVLERLGRKDEAIDLLRSQMTMLTEQETAEAGQMLLLIGLISGRDSGRGQLAFQEILGGKGEADTQRLALYLLAAGSMKEDESRAKFLQTLDELIAQADHPLRDELLLLRSRIKLEEGDLAAADADVAELVDNYPASPLAEDAWWLRAYMAWTESRYRSAADHLGKIRDNLPAGQQRARIGELIGDCYFLKGDYANAADVYYAVLTEKSAYWMAEMVFFQTVLSSTLAKRWDAARELLDQPNSYAGEVLWRAEWTYLDGLRNAGEIDIARERLSKLFQTGRSLPQENAMRWRLLWLDARLAYDAGDALAAANKARQLAIEVESSLNVELSEVPNLAPEVASHLRLLEGQALIRSDQPEEGLAVLQDLRTTYPGSDPAILSILEEARYFAGQYSLAEAQRRLRELADRYRESPHAPAALYEAAIQADRQGLESTRRESLSILRDLIERYPEHPLVFRARLLQGNIARQLGEFGDARVVYETLLRDFADHPEIYLAELYRANSLLARSGDDPALLDEAADGLERLLDLASVPVDVRVEAGYSLSRIQSQQGRLQRASETLWLVIARFLRDPNSARQLGANGSYWMSRCLFELGDILEQDGKVEDARKVYAQIIQNGLPGKNLAAARLEKLRQTGEN